MTPASARLPRVALVSDLREEQWHSMDLVSELLLLGFRDPELRAVDATELCPRLVRRATRLPWAGHIRRVATADRLVNRFWDYPRWLRQQTGDFDLFHIVDHSYAHLAADLPSERTLVMCHDLDAFEAALPGQGRRSPLARALAQRLIDGIRRASIPWPMRKPPGCLGRSMPSAPRSCMSVVSSHASGSTFCSTCSRRCARDIRGRASFAWAVRSKKRSAGRRRGWASPATS